MHHKLGHVSEKGLLGGDATAYAKPGEACVQEIQLMVKFSSVEHSSKEVLE